MIDRTLEIDNCHSDKTCPTLLVVYCGISQDLLIIYKAAMKLGNHILIQLPGPRLNIKTVLSTYGDFLTAVLSLTWELPYLVRPSFLLRRPPGY